MIKILLLIGIEALNLFLCIYLAYGLPGEKEEGLTGKQKVLLLLACAAVIALNVVNLRYLYFNNLMWIQTDLFLLMLFKCIKGRHHFIRGGIAILVKHLTIYMDYAIGFLLIGSGNERYSMRAVLYNERLDVTCIFLSARVILLIAAIILLSQIEYRFTDFRQTRMVLMCVDIIGYIGVLLFQQLFLREINQIYVNSFYVTLVMGIILCIAFFAYNSIISRREREQLIYTTSKLMERNYQKLYDEQKRLEHTAHDFKNHINLLIKYLEEEKYQAAIDYGKKLTSPLEVVSRRSWSGNKILDTILNTKLSEAEQKRIQVHMEIDNMTKLPLTDYDLCVVLSNLFDNAIEACEYVEKQRKEISVSIKSTGYLFIIKIVNSMEKKPIKRNHQYYTTKSDKDVHGIGLESVRASIEKYQGTLLLKHTENEFTAVVSIMGKSDAKIQERVPRKKERQNIKKKGHIKNDREERIYWGFKGRVLGD